MGEAYFNLKSKLEDLGYSNALPVDAVPLVECILADLLQTTRSLQHYMNLSKDALKQRDSLFMEAEPYRCENAKLIQENNQLHREAIELKEEIERNSKDSKRKIRQLTEELIKKDNLITKLQHDNRELSLRGLCAETQSTRNKSRRKDAGDNFQSKMCACSEKGYSGRNENELEKAIEGLEEKIEIYKDEVDLLKAKLEHREQEIIRLNMVLEGGRPPTGLDCCKGNSESKVQELKKQLFDMEMANNQLKKEIASGLDKQHEAMLRALNLAEKNKILQDELQKVDALALKVEEDCNRKLSDMMNEINDLQSKLETLSNSNTQREKMHYSQRDSKHSLHGEKSGRQIETALQNEIKRLSDINQKLQDKINVLTATIEKLQLADQESFRGGSDKRSSISKEEMEKLLGNERVKYEAHITEVQGKLNETLSIFTQHLSKCRHGGKSPNSSNLPESFYVKDLHKKLCESEQKILMLKKDNDELKKEISNKEFGAKENYKDIISQLNKENSELSQENISLCKKLSQYQTSANLNKNVYSKTEVQNLKDEIEKLTQEIQILNRDKKEYNARCKEAQELTDKLRRDLTCKQKEIEKLQEENCSYKMSHRTGKASADRLRDECNFLREQIKRMQTDLVKEKTLASQIKHLHLETERSSNEVQNELLTLQKKLNLSKDKIDSLENKCKELQSEITSLKNEKVNLLDCIKKVDQERDKLVIELDLKAETICTLEQKLKTYTIDNNSLESEIADLKRKANLHKVTEHKLADCEAQIAFLNNEILRINQKFESAVIENKHLQNSLADVNGTLKITRIEYEKSKREVEELKQQLQHYVAEIRRIEELLSQKEAERSDMLEHFASLSVEANILENNNQSLESESASKSLQLQSYVSKIESLEAKLLEKDTIIENQSSRIASMTCKITSLENEIKLINEEKTILEQNISYLKKMCNNLNSDNMSMAAGMGDTETEVKLYESKIRSLNKAKAELAVEKDELKEKLSTTEKLLSNARKEVVDLKVALQDATSETQSLQERITRLSRREEPGSHETCLPRDELHLPLRLEETVHEISHEEDEDSSRFFEIRKRFSKYSQNSTL